MADYAFRIWLIKLGIPTIDLFASRINRKCSRYCSWDGDPDVLAINAFTICWKDEFYYAIHLFNLNKQNFKED